MMESRKRFSRETYIVGGVAIFIIVSGIVAYAVIAMNQAPQPLDEQLWFRIMSEESDGTPLNSTLALITISGVSGDFYETMLYVSDGEWQPSDTAFELGDVIRFVVYFYENGQYYDATYRIGRGPVSVNLGNYEISFISYWEQPDY